MPLTYFTISGQLFVSGDVHITHWKFIDVIVFRFCFSLLMPESKFRVLISRIIEHDASYQIFVSTARLYSIGMVDFSVTEPGISRYGPENIVRCFTKKMN